jgi:hypothetical protein
MIAHDPRHNCRVEGDLAKRTGNLCSVRLAALCVPSEQVGPGLRTQAHCIMVNRRALGSVRLSLCAFKCSDCCGRPSLIEMPPAADATPLRTAGSKERPLINLPWPEGAVGWPAIHLWRYQQQIIRFRTWVNSGARSRIVVKALCYKPGGRGFETDEVNDIYQFT